MSQLLLIDGHVHYHNCYDAVCFLDSARANFQRFSRLANSGKTLGCLLLADCVGQESTSELVSAERNDDIGPWSFQDSGDGSSLLAYRDGSLELILIKGRQIVTGEKIEVLALATQQEFCNGLPLTETLEIVCASEALLVLPWGFGKWWFRRGDFVRTVLQRPAFPRAFCQQETFLGDNGCRTQLLGRPRMFQLAEAAGGRILPGSDPLPLRSHMSRAGSYGFVLRGPFDSDCPAFHVKTLLETNRTQPATFGHLRAFGGFCRDQSGMQLRKCLARLKS